jgi:PhzF family phenazine biosynthesis protein
MSGGSFVNKLAMYQVDAFTAQVFRGNPAAVLVLDDWLPDDVMQAIAMENNLAETAFLRRADEGWELRWFTPVHEAQFCGHATLAAAHVLDAELGVSGDMRFSTCVGTLAVVRRAGAYHLDLPAFPPQPSGELADEASRIVAQQVVACFRNFENVFVELADEDAVRGFEPDVPAIAGLFPLGLAVTARGEGHDFVSRYFAPGAGIPEDPVTGSTHATLVPYWAGKLGKERLSAFQCSRRGGRLLCELAGDRVLLAGEAVTFMKAEIRLPS